MMRVVTPYRQQAPESAAHRKLGPFDWGAAIEMLTTSVQLACGCETVALTDQTTPMEGQHIRFETEEPRLMLWLLEVCLNYLRSEDFDRDTVMLSPDTLVFKDLRPWFKADLGVIIRSGEKYQDKPMLNGAQFWRVSAKTALVDFYARALALGRQCSENELRWGADTTPLLALLQPFRAGPMERNGLHAFGLESTLVFRTIRTSELGDLLNGQRPAWPVVPIVDFKAGRKKAMLAYYHATIGARMSV